MFSFTCTDPSQNRELQIMRIVRHPNIVELKAFYYSNGDRVRDTDTLMGVQTALMAAQKDDSGYVPMASRNAASHIH